ncbi:hypothetical protein [Piscinibacter gummiphilus]|uniref:MSP domain-containing protein n=1 Tax=Piscinibacter gummiphilus TaxID=946333 RepID=A0ABZ0CYB7_9BURK|nr:hypothetical protein [Piscinibacter gummiphilus]WOB09920.1 hypothetical protein RXV79_07590 [Piscinibacter gummiphilus]
MIRNKYSNKSVVVRVIAFRKKEGSPVEVKVTPDVLDMELFDKGPKVITWKLDTVGFRFAPEGAIEITSPGAEKVFGRPVVSKEGRVVKVTNENNDGRAYAYNVRVLDEETQEVTVLDPSIGNRRPY